MTSRWSTVFLDRDGTINVKADEDHYIADPDQVVLLPGAAPAIRRLNETGRLVIVVSNQRGVARGRYDLARLDEITARLSDLLAAEGAHVDAYYYCPHDKDECDCRKPLPGLLLRAASEHSGIDLRAAVLVGDAESDVGAAVAAGVAAIKLGSTSERATAHASDLSAAVDLIVDG